ncbi:MAG TPA: ADP-glyceromanno-heptose 6-epimerase [Gemmatimonadaceae bacterium]|nr:ADP-glyceromanno-heptose 6-epimerase [Gemmatimonadaceae bacterium]
MNFADSRILVTGGAGFIGSALVWELNRRGSEQIVISDLLGSTVKWQHLRPLRFEDYLEADELLESLRSGDLGQFDLVLHMGACSSTTEQDAAYLVRNNYEFTKDLAYWALHVGVRFAYASSAATYGDGSGGMRDDDDLGALQQLRPLNMYGYSKHLFDVYAARSGWLSDIAGLKYFNVFGPNEEHKGDMRSMVHKAYEQIRDSGRVRLFRSHNPDYADGDQLRDFLYVKDAVDMTLHVAGSDASGLFNVGSGSATSWKSLAHAVFSAMEKQPQIEYIDIPEAIRDKYQYFTEADISKLRDTGYDTAVTELETAVADYVQNYLAPGKHLGEE